MGFSYNVNVLNQKGSPAIYTDTFANRPAFGFAGRLFIANDTAAIYEDTGTSWVLIANVSSGAGTLQQVTTNGNTSNVGISVTAGGVSTNSATITSLTQGSVPFVGTAGLITQDNANLFFDDTNNRLGINTNTPSNNLDVHGTGTTALIALNNTAGNQSLIAFAKNSTAKWRIGNSSTDFFEILNVALSTNAIRISSANNSTVFISSVQADDFLIQPTGYSLLASLSRNLTGTGYGVLSLRNNANGTIQPSSLTVDRTYTLPDATGTIALTSDLGAYLPLTGGTLTGTLINEVSDPNVNFLAKKPTGGSIQISGSTGTTNNILLQGSNSTNPNLEILVGGSTKQTITSSGQVNFVSRLNVNNAIDDGLTSLNVIGSGKFTTNIDLFSYISINKDGSNTVGSGPYLALIQTTNAKQWIIQLNGSQGLTFFNFNGTVFTSPLIISETGVLTLLNLAGTGSRAVLADANGNLSAPVSDETVKQNIQPLQYGLNAIMQLNPISFEYIDDYKNYGEGLQIGNIAQDVAKVIPEAVFTTPSTGLMGINYNQFDGIYIKAIQELNNKIDTLLQRIELLENK